jgi:hypothetical protein
MLDQVYIAIPYIGGEILAAEDTRVYDSQSCDSLSCRFAVMQRPPLRASPEERVRLSDCPVPKTTAWNSSRRST